MLELKAPSADAPSDSASIEAEFAIAAQIELLLIGHTNASVGRILSSVAVRHGRKVVPISLPCGTNVPEKRGNTGQKSRNGRLSSTNVIAPWKQDPQWIALSGERQNIVARLKELAPSDPNKGQLVEDLRELERAMKELRDKLKH